jgi:hypothetical protein
MGSIQTPFRPTSVADMKNIGPGEYFINPADGQVYQRPTNN